MPKKKKATQKSKKWMRMVQSELTEASKQTVWDYANKTGVDPDTLMPAEVWSNDRYQATVRYLQDDRDGLCQVCIHSHTRSTNRPWRHFQQIKNDLFGDEREAMELYPAESRLVDTANEFHLWVWKKDSLIPVGFNTGRDVQYDPAPVPGTKARQAPKLEVVDQEPRSEGSLDVK